MQDWLAVIILGIIEGITEFIPVSSTGHLLLAEKWVPKQSDLFVIVIQCGAALALVPLFSKKLRELLFGLHEPDNRDLFSKLTLAFVITGAGGLILKKLGMTLPDESAPIAWALLIGGVAMLLTELFVAKRTMTDRVTWGLAVAFGVAQLVAAVFPGASRSGTTIILAMLLGLNRARATEFSFLLGIPTLLIAGAYEIYGELKKQPMDGPQEDWGLLALGTVVSAIVSFFVVKWLIRFVQSHTFNGFALYRIALGGGMLWYFWPAAK